MDISIIGSGYVGLVTGACFADVGHNVICVDNDPRKVESLQAGKVPIYEPGLEEVIHRNVSAQRLRFTGSIQDGVENSQIVFIAVPTPQQPDGSVDLSFIEKVAREIAGVLTSYRVIVDKSTVPVKTGEKVRESIKRYNRHGAEFDVVSNPEFLREGCAVADLMHPDRIVIGAQSEHAIDLMKKVYEPFMAPILVTDINSAELIKHAANSFLALKISYINAVSAICEASGADMEKVADGIGMDRRIGRSFLNAGIGYGGSCFPKDIAAFITICDQLGVPFNLLKEVQRINADQKTRFLKSIRETLWVLRDKKIAVWGLAFKPDTDDLRSSVAIELVSDMLKEGAHVTAYDPKGMEKAREVEAIAGAKFAQSALETVEGAEALDRRHGVGGIRQRRSRNREGEDDDADYFRRAQLVRSRDDGQARFSLPFHRARKCEAALRWIARSVARIHPRSMRSEFSSRGVALAALREWRTGEQFADSILARLLRSSDLTGSGPRLHHRTVLRDPPQPEPARFLDRIAQIRASGSMTRATYCASASTNFFSSKTPEHAAVYETVELAGRKESISRQRCPAQRRPRKRGARGKGGPSRISALETSHPQFLIDRWRRKLRRGKHGGSLRVEQPPGSDLRPDQSSQDFGRGVSLRDQVGRLYRPEPASAGRRPGQFRPSDGRSGRRTR